MFKILDLFCGAGGMSHGMDMNPNFETVVAVDINENTNLPNSVLNADITPLPINPSKLPIFLVMLIVSEFAPNNLFLNICH